VSLEVKQDGLKLVAFDAHGLIVAQAAFSARLVWCLSHKTAN
jgi:hypothetical protein